MHSMWNKNLREKQKKTHTLIVYSSSKIQKFKYTIEITASKVLLTLKIHTLIVYPSLNFLSKRTILASFLPQIFS